MWTEGEKLDYSFEHQLLPERSKCNQSTGRILSKLMQSESSYFGCVVKNTIKLGLAKADVFKEEMRCTEILRLAGRNVATALNPTIKSSALKFSTTVNRVEKLTNHGPLK